MIYLDTSVALAHLLAEDGFPPDLLWDQQLVSSRLLECEVWNRINAYQLQNSHGDAVRNLIGRVAMIEMVGPVLARALQPFPFRCEHWMLSTSRPLNLSAHKSRACSSPATMNVYLRQRAFSELQSGARASEPR